MELKVIIVIILSLGLSLYFFPKDNKEKHYSKMPDYFIVKVEGEVLFEGDYKFYQRVSYEDVISLAGGFLIDADLSNFDGSKLINSNTTIKINKIKDEKDNIDTIIKINLNEATYQMLLMIPNITDNRAANIILYRKENGNFTSIEQLKNVKYIKEATYEKIAPYFFIK